MKAVLVIDVPVLDDGRHLCNECPIWNKERLFCEYDFNMETKGCPLKPMPNMVSTKEKTGSDVASLIERSYIYGWNACIEEIEGEGDETIQANGS